VKLRWKDISVLPGSGIKHLKPFLQVSDAALAGSKHPKFHLSITHDAGLVVAMVVVEDTL
jgi:phosphopantetheinyl transferase (holo-ACP synthase)